MANTLNHLSVDKVISIAKTIPTIKIRLPKQNKVIYRTMILTPKHKAIAKSCSEELPICCFKDVLIFSSVIFSKYSSSAD
jgi:hypothetical protein